MIPRVEELYPSSRQGKHITLEDRTFVFFLNIFFDGDKTSQGEPRLGKDGGKSFSDNLFWIFLTSARFVPTTSLVVFLSRNRLWAWSAGTREIIGVEY